MPGVCDLSDDIQRDINANYGVFYQMYADVANQSTSSLVEGVPDDEDKYDYAFYFGEKRNLLSGSPAKDRPVYSNYVFRDDYYKDGGYICPAFIEYTSVFQATNARGEWQYIVNVKPWTQTGKVPLNATVVPPGEEFRFWKNFQHLLSVSGNTKIGLKTTEMWRFQMLSELWSHQHRNPSKNLRFLSGGGHSKSGMSSVDWILHQTNTKSSLVQLVRFEMSWKFYWSKQGWKGFLGKSFISHINRKKLIFKKTTERN